ncbi:MAG TPA: hypothetical protein VLB46_15555 [Pyrinomonadaceae bacterium]|nr:hypothetical protein [Pyrinomonadaceae bacterium]
MTLTPGTRLNRYEILSKLGEGGMGEVFLAEDTSLRRKIAIKILQSPFMADDKARQRLVREARYISERKRQPRDIYKRKAPTARYISKGKRQRRDI